LLKSAIFSTISSLSGPLSRSPGIPANQSFIYPVSNVYFRLLNSAASILIPIGPEQYPYSKSSKRTWLLFINSYCRGSDMAASSGNSLPYETAGFRHYNELKDIRLPGRAT
jgi:hypothetical protein